MSNETFRFGLGLVAETGVRFSGVLCGRATWEDGVAIFVEEGLAALEQWLARDGVRNVQSVHQRLSAATPWFASYGVSAVNRG